MQASQKRSVIAELSKDVITGTIRPGHRIIPGAQLASLLKMGDSSAGILPHPLGGSTQSRKRAQSSSPEEGFMASSGEEIETIQQAKRKKYIVRSYLFNAICQFPRKYTHKFLGREILRTYYTMPLRLSMSRFVSNKFLKGYYNHLSEKALSKTAKLSRWKKGIELQTHRTSLLSGFSFHGAKSLGPNPTSPRTCIAQKSKNEVGKKFLIALEQRLDNSLLRLLNFKPRYLTKQA